MTLQTEQPPQTASLEPINRQMIVILDFGSQYSELIARRIRETQVYSEVLSYRTTAEQLKQLNPKGIIFSGGPSSVYDAHAPHCDASSTPRARREDVESGRLEAARILFQCRGRVPRRQKRRRAD